MLRESSRPGEIPLLTLAMARFQLLGAQQSGDAGSSDADCVKGRRVEGMAGEKRSDRWPGQEKALPSLRITN
jgi:hypothetical protein